MAQVGFPWQSESHIREPTYLDEKGPQPAKNEPPKAPMGDVGTKSISLPHGRHHAHSIHSMHSIGKRRANSVKAQTSTKQPTGNVMGSGPGRSAPAQLQVRTIPPWVRDAEESDVEALEHEDLPDSPSDALVAQHHYGLSSHHPMLGGPRRKGGHMTLSGEMRPERTSRWVSFARASAYPREVFDSEKVDQQWLDANFTDYSKPWLADRNEDDDEEGSGGYKAFQKKRKVWYKRIQYTVLRNPFVPLAFRFTVITFACVAIGLGAKIFQETGKIRTCISQEPGARSEYCKQLIGDKIVDYYRDPAALMAIIVDVIAVVYSGYITYDEYFSKPLGLRPAKAKVRLVLLDLFFIVFQSANLSLSFESLTVEEGACQVGDEPNTATKFDNVCSRGRALASVLIVSLVAWMMTFSISVLRLVERIA